MTFEFSLAVPSLVVVYHGYGGKVEVYPQYEMLEMGEVERMTLQVGLVGSDGLLLASDSCMVQLGAVRSSSMASKIVMLPRHKVFYCFAGDDCALLTGQDLETKLNTNFDFENIREELKQIGDSRWETEKRKFDLLSRQFREMNRHLTLVFYGRPSPELWQLRISDNSQANHIIDRAVAGDSGNPSVFFTERYFARGQNLSTLKRLAAHFILMGHEFNPATIKGLEIVTVKFGEESPISVGLSELSELIEVSRSLDDQIRARFQP